MHEENQHLGSGLSSPVRCSRRGGLAVSSHAQKVEESLRVILSTSPGERVMRPEFGCDLHSFTFATLDATNLMLIRSAVRRAVERWEPRVELLGVEVDTADSAQGRLSLELHYRVRTTQLTANLVFPFFLNPEA